MVQEKIITDVKSFLQNCLYQKGIDVAEIALFGSFLDNSQNEDSDIDLIVISDDFEKKDAFERVEMIAGIDSKLMSRFKRPFDLLLKSKQEYLMLNKKLLFRAEVIL